MMLWNDLVSLGLKTVNWVHSVPTLTRLWQEAEGGDVENAKQKLEAGGIYVLDELRINPDVFAVMLDGVSTVSCLMLMFRCRQVCKSGGTSRVERINAHRLETSVVHALSVCLSFFGFYKEMRGRHLGPRPRHDCPEMSLSSGRLVGVVLTMS